VKTLLLHSFKYSALEYWSTVQYITVLYSNAQTGVTVNAQTGVPLLSKEAELSRSTALYARRPKASTLTLSEHHHDLDALPQTKQHPGRTTTIRRRRSFVTLKFDIQQ
jgi:hypothetical protein